MKGMIDLIQKASFRRVRGCCARISAAGQRSTVEATSPERVMPRKMQCCLWSDALEVCEESARQIGEPGGLGCQKGRWPR